MRDVLTSKSLQSFVQLLKKKNYKNETKEKEIF